MLKLNDYEAHLVQEITAFTDLTESQVRSMLNSAFLHQMQCLVGGKDIPIPYIGSLHINEEGNIEIIPSDIFLKILTNSQEMNYDIINYILEKNFKKALQDKLN